MVEEHLSASQVIGHYRCRQALWQRAKELNVEKTIFTKDGAKILRLYFDKYESQPDFGGFLDVAARDRHHSVTYGARRQIVERQFHRCADELDFRSRLWLEDGESWESLALLPVTWDQVVEFRRSGFKTIADFEMHTDKEVSQPVKGVGPKAVAAIRNFCRRALAKQKEASKQPRVRKPSRARSVSASSLFP